MSNMPDKSELAMEDGIRRAKLLTIEQERLNRAMAEAVDNMRMNISIVHSLPGKLKRLSEGRRDES